jgi:hypothetical protein
METFAIIVLVIVACIVSSIAHEADMRRAIRKHGHTSMAGWLGRIKGKVED